VPSTPQYPFEFASSAPKSEHCLLGR
jgi:hypothetical protein